MKVLTNAHEKGVESNKVIIEQKENEDERIRERIICRLKYDLEHNRNKFTKREIPEEIAYLEKQKEQKPAELSEEDKEELKYTVSVLERCGFSDSANWLKDLPNRFNLQPKQEWSEEDGKMRKLIVADIKSLAHGDESSMWVGYAGWLEERLNLLCPLPQWKPSDEQMEAFENVIKCELSAGLHTRARICQSLLDDLKKL